MAVTRTDLGLLSWSADSCTSQKENEYTDAVWCTREEVKGATGHSKGCQGWLWLPRAVAHRLRIERRARIRVTQSEVLHTRGWGIIYSKYRKAKRQQSWYPAQ